MTIYGRKTAIVVGTLFIIATVAGVTSVALRGPLEAANAFSDLAARKSEITLGALMVVVMAAAIAMIPAAMFPILKERSEALAVGYVVARTIEVLLLLPAAIGPLCMLAVSTEAGAQFRPLHSLVRTYEGWGGPVSTVFFCLSALLLNYVLYRSSLVPRLLPAWALVAAAPYLLGGLLVMFGVLGTSSTVYSLLVAPLALNEMALALWLLVKGFRSPSPTAAPPSQLNHTGALSS